MRGSAARRMRFVRHRFQPRSRIHLLRRTASLTGSLVSEAATVADSMRSHAGVARHAIPMRSAGQGLRPV